MPVAGKHVVEPEPGLMLVFPSWLYHYVNPFHGSGERITIAFNAILRIGNGGPGGKVSSGPAILLLVFFLLSDSNRVFL